MSDLLLTGDYLVTQTPQGIISSGALWVQDNQIKALGSIQEISSLVPLGTKHLTAEKALIMPGLINCHTHISMTLMRGLADDLPLMTWLNKHIFPMEKKLNKEIVYWGALLGCAELISAGITSFCDMYLWADSIAQAVDKSGLRALLGEVLFGFNSPSYGHFENGLILSEELYYKYKNHPLIDITLNPHSAYSLSPSELKKISQLALKLNTALHIHLSESKAERNAVIKKYGRSPIRHLEYLEILNKKVIAAHLVEVDDEELDILAQKQVSVVHNPQSNLKLASGVARIPEMLSRDISVSLGTDGPASNNHMDLFREMNITAKIHKAINNDPTLLPVKQILAMTTTTAANQLWGLKNKIGTLSIGAPADIIVLELNKAHLIPCYNPLSHLVYAVNGSDVCHTIVNGKILMENRKLRTLDLSEISAKINECLPKLR